MGCASGTMKCILNTANMLLAILGILFIVLASLSLKTSPMPFVYLLYIIGAVNFLAAILGCCGICRENVCMTSLYAILIAASLAFQIYNKIKPVDISEVKKIASDQVLKTWNDMPRSQPEMDKIQQTYKCCGINGPTDYWGKGLSVVPPSCYKDNIINQNAIYSIGCVLASEDAFSFTTKYTKIAEWVGIGVTSVMLLFSIYLIFRFRNKQDHYRY